MTEKESALGRAALQTLATELGGADEARRIAAVGRIAVPPAEGGDIAAALDLLVVALGDDSYLVRREAIAAVLSWPDTMLVAERLVDALGEPDNVGRRNAAVEAVTRLGQEGRMPLDPLL